MNAYVRHFFHSLNIPIHFNIFINSSDTVRRTLSLCIWLFKCVVLAFPRRRVQYVNNMDVTEANRSNMRYYPSIYTLSFQEKSSSNNLSGSYFKIYLKKIATKVTTFRSLLIRSLCPIRFDRNSQRPKPQIQSRSATEKRVFKKIIRHDLD